jgi:hypothetical protein
MTASDAALTGAGVVALLRFWPPYMEIERRFAFMA